MSIVTPDSVSAVAEFVKTSERVVFEGSGSHRGMLVSSTHEESIGAQRLSLKNLKGIQEYEPSEFTITALSGTPVRELLIALHEHRQYFPFDPLLFHSESTLGGVIAAGINGPGRLRYGGIRDFVLGVQCVDGMGNVIRGGGKVVKNAAGFDLPKLVVGSCGMYGILTEITMKVFPEPRATQTLLFGMPSVKAAVAAIERLASQPIAVDAVDLIPDFRTNKASQALQPNGSEIVDVIDGESMIVIRLAGEEAAFESAIPRIEKTIERKAIVIEQPIATHDAKNQEKISEHGWWPSPSQTRDPFAADFLLKVPTRVSEISELDHDLTELGAISDGMLWRRYTMAGAQLWLGGTADFEKESLLKLLRERQLTWQLVQGELSVPARVAPGAIGLATLIKQAFDPNHRLVTVLDQGAWSESLEAGQEAASTSSPSGANS